jgi:hypothetical protein
MGGVEKVFRNLCLGLDRIGAEYFVNLPFNELENDDWVAVLGRGRSALDEYSQKNKIVAGIGLMTHPSEWPTLCGDYPIAYYLQHSDWANEIYKPYFKDKCRTWPVGIDTRRWAPAHAPKRFDFLIYDKVHWERENYSRVLIDPIKDVLRSRKLTFVEMRYGNYSEDQYREALQCCSSMLFLSEHESQGIAYQECLSSGVPILAWNQGWYLDPQRWRWGDFSVRASSVPFFDQRCGLTFRDFVEFERKLPEFLELFHGGGFSPREFIVERLTVERCSENFLQILREANSA